MTLLLIPLCGFKYAGDVYSGATFKYDTSGQIIKDNQRWLVREKLNEIEKESSKTLSGSRHDLYKNSKKTLHKSSYEFIKESLKELRIGHRDVNKNRILCLKSILPGLVKTNNIELERGNILLDIKLAYYLERGYLNFIKSNELELEKHNLLINIQTSKEVGNSTNYNLYIGKYKNLQRLQNIIISIEKDVEITRKWQNEFCKRNVKVILGRENIQVNLSNEIFTERIDEKQFFNSPVTGQLLPEKLININEISVIQYIERTYLKDVNFVDIKYKISRDYLKNIIENSSDKIVNKLTSKEINKKAISKTAYRIASLNIYKYIKKIFSYRYSCRETFKFDHYSLNRIIFTYMFKSKFYKALRRKIDKNIYYNKNFGLKREAVTNTNKIFSRYLDYRSFTNIYKQAEEALLNASILNIFKNKSYNLGSLSKDLYKEANYNKFIEITKRWWWLDPTDPRDNLVIPSKDFSYNQDILNNLDYEYLRFTNHPIGWGNTWGIDWNIPAYAVSIEIMLDIVNILVMIWHDNVQGWLCCSGKESMQFVMELLYDWYTLGTSKPNADYYRAYRWIRWEAEKVYFLNLDNGLQAVGILIANLIDYLKNHEFNLVPIWRNPKAMDIERNFNRIAQNGDLMKDLDKTKGKRYYYIDTQNIEKKNILGDDINGSNS